MNKKKVVILASYYIPGVKGGGPIQSIKNIVDNLAHKFDFYIITLDRDLGDTEPYKNIVKDTWQDIGNSKVYYISKENFKIKYIKCILNDLEYDVLYLNSFFSIKTGIAPIILRRLGKIRNTEIVMAPRGQFSDGALKIGKLKKKVYIDIFKILGMHRYIRWHATAYIEKNDIENIFGKDASVRVANNLTASYNEIEYTKSIKKENGSIKLVFISRISPKKNLHKAIEFLKNINGKVEFDIYGPIEDNIYWKECQTKMKDLSDNILINYKGIIGRNDIHKMFLNYHMLLFPTLGENFGHVISEALIGGCPVIISNRTPWRNLEEFNCGWDIELEDDTKFRKCIQDCVYMDQTNYNELSRNAFKYAKVNSNTEKDLIDTMKLFCDN